MELPGRRVVAADRCPSTSALEQRATAPGVAAAGLLPNEKVQVVDIDNGARLETYVIPGAAGSADMCLDGAAARLEQPGDP